MRKGFSLMESMLSLALTLVIVLAACEFFGVSRAFFFRLKERSEDRQAALAALDMIGRDMRRAGEGLSAAIRFGLVPGLWTEAGRLHMERCEKDLGLAADVQPGQTVVAANDAQGLKPGRRLCLIAGQQGQILKITDVRDKALMVSPAAHVFFPKEESSLLLLETAEYYLDGQSGVVRRKENDGPGQPLLEEVALWECAFRPESFLATVRLAVRRHEEKVHEIHIFPKNLAPVFRQ